MTRLRFFTALAVSVLIAEGLRGADIPGQGVNSSWTAEDAKAVCDLACRIGLRDLKERAAECLCAVAGCACRAALEWQRRKAERARKTEEGQGGEDYIHPNLFLTGRPKEE